MARRKGARRAPRNIVRSKVPAGTSPKAFGSGVEFEGGLGWNQGWRNASPALFGGNAIFTAPMIWSAQQEIKRNRTQAVANARHVDRNSGQMKGGVSKKAVSLVGAQIRLQALPNYRVLGITATQAADFAQAWENEFSLWGDDQRALNDAERHLQFGGQMLLAARNAVGPDGECAMIVRYSEERMAKYGARYATFLEVLDPDRISTPADIPETERNNIVNGRKLDKWGAYEGFYVQKNHPAEGGRAGTKWEYVPREDEAGRPMGIHWFFKHRAQAQRGMPGIIASLRKSKMLDQYDDAKLERAVLQALLSIYVETTMPSEEVLRRLQTQAPAAGSGDWLNSQWDFRFGMYDELKLSANGVRIPVLPFGDKISMGAVDAAGTDDSSFRSAFARAMASELGLSYEQFSGDYSETTYAGARAGLIDNWRLVVCDRHMLTQATGALVAMAVLEEAVATGKITTPRGAPNFWDNMSAWSQCNFMGPGMGWVDPLNEVKAAGERIALGISSRSYEASLQGQDHRDVIDQIASDNAYAESRKVEVVTPGAPIPAAEDAPRKPGDAGGGQEARK